MSIRDPAAAAEADAARSGWDVATATVVAGLTAGWVLGFAGGMFEPGTAREVAWAISSTGIMAGTVLLAVRHASTDIPLAAGFVLLALGEAVLHTQGTDSLDAFAAATYAYVPALLLTAASTWPPGWARATAAAASLGFGIHAGLYLAGQQPAIDGPVATVGYALLGITMIGWTWQTTRTRPS